MLIISFYFSTILCSLIFVWLQCLILKLTGPDSLPGLIYLISAPASPLLGLLIDKTGLNVSYVFVAISVTMFCHILLAFSFVNPYVAISIMGVAYSLLASALWPIAALSIPEHQLGTAYGNSDLIDFTSSRNKQLPSIKIKNCKL